MKDGPSVTIIKYYFYVFEETVAYIAIHCNVLHGAGSIVRLSFIHPVFCPTTGPKPPPKRCLYIVRSRASSFKWQYPLLSLRSSCSFLRLLPRLLVTSISPFIFHSITCFRRHFLRKMWPIKIVGIHSFIQYSVWRHVQSLLQNDASI